MTRGKESQARRDDGEPYRNNLALEFPGVGAGDGDPDPRVLLHLGPGAGENVGVVRVRICCQPVCHRAYYPIELDGDIMSRG